MGDSAILVAIVGLVSAILGGLIHAFATRDFERYKFEQESKWDLYTKYFITLGELAFSEGGSERRINAMSLMAQLRGRIGIVGSSEVIKAVGETFKFAEFNDPSSQAALARALNAMRKDVGKRRDPVGEAELVQLLFGSREESS